MGGLNSGRWNLHTRKATTEEMISLDVLFMLRRGGLKSGNGSTWTWSRNGEAFASICTAAYPDHVLLIYSSGSGESRRSHEYPVDVEWTPCHFGGSRPWFHCPRCGRRVRKLYGGTLFHCRACHRLAYDVQRESDSCRMRRRADKVRDRLGWNSGGPGDGWQKPKGMHWDTFERLSLELDRREAEADVAFMKRACSVLGWDFEERFGRREQSVNKA